MVGLGVMGERIARAFADAGHDVRGVDARVGHAERVLAGSRARSAASIAEAVADASLVIEAVFEDLATKHALLVELEAATDAVLASNTSTFTPSELGSVLADPGRLVVAHWFNPADVVPLVEVVPHPATPAHVVDDVVDVLRDGGWRPVPLAMEADGFVGNRLQAALVREAMHLIEQGVATPEQVDAVVTLGLGPRWAAVGPMRVMELGGLDVWQAVASRLFPVLSQAQEAPAMLRDAVAEGRLGAKSGAGFAELDAAVVDADRAAIDARFAGMRRRDG